MSWVEVRTIPVGLAFARKRRVRGGDGGFVRFGTDFVRGQKAGPAETGGILLRFGQQRARYLLKAGDEGMLGLGLGVANDVLQHAQHHVRTQALRRFVGHLCDQRAVFGRCRTIVDIAAIARHRDQKGGDGLAQGFGSGLGHRRTSAGIGRHARQLTPFGGQFVVQDVGLGADQFGVKAEIVAGDATPVGIQPLQSGPSVSMRAIRRAAS